MFRMIAFEGVRRWTLVAVTMMTSQAAWVHAATRQPQATGQVGQPSQDLQIATFGGGCFWCTEAVFQRLKGVQAVVSGYSGGQVPNPTYEQVCSGLTGHAEVVQVRYDPGQVSFKDLLEVFWKTHDPTTLNRQGPDIGTQYRSVVFFHSQEQRQLAEHYKQQLNASGAFGAPIVTQIVPFLAFFPAEKYHQDYYEQNSRKSYCSRIIRPKLDKLEKVFADKLKTPASKSTTAVKRK